MVSQYTLDGKYITTFRSVLAASVETGTEDSNIARAAKGHRWSAGGYLWKYAVNTYDLHKIVHCQCCGKVTAPDAMVNISVECLQRLKG